MKLKYKTILFLADLLMVSLSGQAFAAVSSNIIVDQFGYQTTAPKIVIFAQPNTGLGSPSSYNLGAGATFQVINSSGGATVFTGNAVTWNGGAVDSTFSGDKVWQGTFTSLSAPGTYYVQVPGGSNPGSTSYNFQIADNVFNGVVTASQRMFFYQRCGGNISALNGGANWNHTACHEGVSQDLTAHLWSVSDQGAGTARDVHGGWHDAGDYGKYVTFAHASMWYLFHSAEWYPLGYTDNTNIPESGNGVPDMLDEVKFELDWMLRMQRASDGALYSMVGFSNASGSNNQGNPAADTASRYYLNVSTTATATGCMAFALGARLFQTYGAAYPGYSASVSAAAVSAWNYLQAHAAPVTFDSTNVSSANANQSASWDAQARVAAAAELFALTGSAVYQTYFDSNYNSNAVTDTGGFRPVSNPPNAGTDHFDSSLCEPLQLGMVSYALAPGATAAVVTAIKNSIKNECQNYIMNQQVNDPYLGYMYPGHYTWGSNQLKASWANQLLFAVKTGANPAQNSAYTNQAEEYLHYFHGRNPLNWVYLTNMGTKGANLGASKPIMSIYHSWFWQGTTFDGNTGAGALGPAPGILAGGPNQNFAPDASYSGPTLNPPQGQPPMKSYKDWGNTWPEDSWEVTEPDQGYQAKYQFLLSAFASTNAPTPTPTATPTGTLATATFTATLTTTNSPTQTPTPTATTCVQLLNGAESLAENGTWSGTNANRTVSTLNFTQGTHSLQAAVTTKLGWNDQVMNLAGFTPTSFTNVLQVQADLYVSPSLMGATYTQLFLSADSSAPATYEQPLASNYVDLVSGQNYNLTFNISLTGAFTPGSPITKLYFIYNSDSAAGTGSFYLDNIRLITTCAAPTNTPTNSPTRTPSASPTNSPTATPTRTPTNSSTITPTPTGTDSTTPTPSATLTATPSASPTKTPTNTSTLTPTDSLTPTITNTPTNSFTGTLSPSDTPTITPTSTLTSSSTPTPTFTVLTNTFTPTNSVTSTASSTPTRTPTQSPTASMTRTATPSPTNSVTTVFTPTASPTKTPTSTGTSTVTQTATPTLAATSTLTFTPTPTLTAASGGGSATPGPGSKPDLFPNPLDGTSPLTIRTHWTAPMDVKVQLFTTAFRKVIERNFPNVPVGGDVPIDLVDHWGTPLASGLYYVVVVADSDKSVGKILVLR